MCAARYVHACAGDATYSVLLENSDTDNLAVRDQCNHGVVLDSPGIIAEDNVVDDWDNDSYITLFVTRCNARHCGYVSRRHPTYNHDSFGRVCKRLSTVDLWFLPLLSRGKCRIVCVHGEQSETPTASTRVLRTTKRSSARDTHESN